MNNLIETTGYKIRKKDSDERPSQHQQEQLYELTTMEDNEEVPKKPAKFLANSKNLLRQEFNFYTFGLELG